MNYFYSHDAPTDSRGADALEGPKVYMGAPTLTTSSEGSRYVIAIGRLLNLGAVSAAVSSRPWISNVEGIASAWVARFRTALNGFRNLGHGWDNRDAAEPSTAAIRQASLVLDRLANLDLRPTRIAPAVDGDIVISFSGPDGRATMRCVADGRVLVTVAPRDAEIDSWELQDAADPDMEEVLRQVLDGTRPSVAYAPLVEAG